MIFKTISQSLKKLPILGLSAAVAVTLSSCGTVSSNLKDKQLNRVSLPVFMIERNISVDAGRVLAFERVHNASKVAQIYIEGHDLSTAHRLTTLDFVMQGTSNPVALRLAAQDKHSNVIYLTAPCQTERHGILRGTEANNCINHFYSNGAVSHEIVDAYNEALNNIRRYHGVTEFELNGYASGGAVAAVLAAERADVVGLRTVASRLDRSDYPELKYNAYHPTGINPVDVASNLAHLPQYHFIGAKDHAEKLKLYHNYAQAVGPTWCMRHSIIPDADDEDGWVEQWKLLRALDVNCYADRENAAAEPEVDLTPVPFNPATLDAMDDMHGRGKK